MTHWVFIVKDGQGALRTGLTVDFELNFSTMEQENQVVYLRAFAIPFDAVAHKHLIDDLSPETVAHLINRHKRDTGMQLSFFESKR